MTKQNICMEDLLITSVSLTRIIENTFDLSEKDGEAFFRKVLKLLEEQFNYPDYRHYN